MIAKKCIRYSAHKVCNYSGQRQPTVVIGGSHKNKQDLKKIYVYIYIYKYINLLVSGVYKVHNISYTVFHAARNLQGEGVDVAVVE